MKAYLVRMILNKTNPSHLDFKPLSNKLILLLLEESKYLPLSFYFSKNI